MGILCIQDNKAKKKNAIQAQIKRHIKNTYIRENIYIMQM